MFTPLNIPPVIVDRTDLTDGEVSALVLRCGGEIDSFNAHELSDAVRDGLTTAERLLLVDLREVTFLGASAITALLVGATDNRGVTRLRLIVGHNRPVRLVIAALELHTTFSIHDDIAHALHHTHEPPASNGPDPGLSTGDHEFATQRSHPPRF